MEGRARALETVGNSDSFGQTLYEIKGFHMQLCPHCKAVQLSSAVVCSKCGKGMNSVEAAAERGTDATGASEQTPEPAAREVPVMPEVVEDPSPEAVGQESENLDKGPCEEGSDDDNGIDTVYGTDDDEPVQIYGRDEEESSVYEGGDDTVYEDQDSSGIYELSEEDRMRRQELIEEMEEMQREGYLVTRLQQA